MLEVGFGLEQDYYQCAILLSFSFALLSYLCCLIVPVPTIILYIIAKGTLILYLQMIKLVVALG